MDARVATVELSKAYRLLNHGPTVLVSARHGGEQNVMAAAWCCALDYSPTKVTVVLEQTSMTRSFGAWADQRVFRDGRWHFETADQSLRSIHHVAGGHFYAIGRSARRGAVIRCPA